MQPSDRIRSQFADIMGGGSIFTGTRRRVSIDGGDDGTTPLFHSEANPDHSCSPPASLTGHPDLPFPQLDGEVLSPGPEVDPYKLSATESDHIEPPTRKSQKLPQDNHPPREEHVAVESGTEIKNRSSTASPSITAAKRTRAGAGWWAHQSIFPSGLLPSSSTRSNSRNPTSSGRSKATRSRRRRDLDDVYNSDEESDGSETSMTSGSKASDPPSPSSLLTMHSRTIRHSRSGHSHHREPHRHSRGNNHSDLDPPYTSDTDSDFSSGSSLASTSTASGLLSPSEDIAESVSPNSRSEERARGGKRASGRSSRIHRERGARKTRTEDGDMHDPEFGQGDLESLMNTRGGVIPDRLEVYQDRFGPWKGQAAFRKYKDAPFLALWLASLSGIVIGLFFVWGATTSSPIPPGADVPSNPSPPAPGQDPEEYRTPFTTLLHTIPLLAALLWVALAAPFGLLILLRKTVRPVLIGTAVCVPFVLIMTSWWAFIASFEAVPSHSGTDAEPNWWGTVGLRWCSLIPLILAGISTALVWRRRKRLQRSVAVVELATTFLIDHPILLLVTPALLVIFSLVSLPFLTLLLRLLLVGYYRHPRENTYIWHLKPYTGWLIALVTLLWLWTWVIIRGIGRVVIAAVLGEWYFHQPDLKDQDLLDITTAAVHRATGPNLGSICLSSLIVAVTRMVGKAALTARKVTHPRSNILPGPLSFLSAMTPLFTFVASILDQLNGYALVYVGITGQAFWPSARKAVGLVRRRHQAHLLDYTLVKLLLTLCSTTVAVGTATAGYLYATHTLSAPAHAPFAALLCGGVVFLAVRAGMSVLGDTADALFICYAIDRETGGHHNEKVVQAFSDDVTPRSG